MPPDIIDVSHLHTLFHLIWTLVFARRSGPHCWYSSVYSQHVRTCSPLIICGSPSSLRLRWLPYSLHSLTHSPTMIAPPLPVHQQPTLPMNNPAAPPCSITKTHSDPPSPPHPPAQGEINPQEVQEHLGDVVIPGKLHLVLPNHPLRIGGGVWKIPCTLLGMLWMVGMLELMGISRGWLRLFRVLLGRSLVMDSLELRAKRVARASGESEWCARNEVMGGSWERLRECGGTICEVVGGLYIHVFILDGVFFNSQITDSSYTHETM